MDALEYQDECSLIRYPFRDGASMLWTNGSASGVLPDTVFRDALLSPTPGSVGNVHLSSIVNNGTNWIVNFSGLAAFSFTINSTSRSISTYTNRTSSGVLTVDIDSFALAQYFSSNSLLIGTYNFDTSCLLCLGCVKLSPPNITRITFSNTSQPNPNASPTSVTVADITVGGIGLSEGTNLAFQVVDQDVVFSVVAGSGQGLYDSCGVNKQPVLTINNTAPSTNGNFYIKTDNCYSLIAGTNALYLVDNCDPECPPSSIVNFAHYINRVVDATTQLNALASLTNTNYNELVANYNSCEASKLAAQTPYILAQASTQTNKVNQFLNITCGIYNPGSIGVGASLSIAYHSNLSEVAGT